MTAQPETCPGCRRLLAQHEWEMTDPLLCPGTGTISCESKELERLRSEVARLEGEQEAINSEGFDNASHLIANRRALIERSERRWTEMVGQDVKICDLIKQLSAATAEIERLRAERDTLTTRLRHLADLASPEQVPGGYEDAVILAAIRERDDLRGANPAEDIAGFIEDYRAQFLACGQESGGWDGYDEPSVIHGIEIATREHAALIRNLWRRSEMAAALSQPAPAPSEESEPPTAGEKGTGE